MSILPKYKNIFKSLNINTEEELHTFIKDHNHGHLPKIGGGINEEYGSDHYGYEIVLLSTDKSVIGYREINGTNSVFFAMICTDKRKKNLYGKYVPASVNEKNILTPYGHHSMWISDDLRLTELDPSF